MDRVRDVVRPATVECTHHLTRRPLVASHGTHTQPCSGVAKSAARDGLSREEE